MLDGAHQEERLAGFRHALDLLIRAVKVGAENNEAGTRRMLEPVFDRLGEVIAAAQSGCSDSTAFERLQRDFDAGRDEMKMSLPLLPHDQSDGGGDGSGDAGDDAPASATVGGGGSESSAGGGGGGGGGGAGDDAPANGAVRGGGGGDGSGEAGEVEEALGQGEPLGQSVTHASLGFSSDVVFWFWV